MLRAVEGHARPRGSASERRRARPALRSARGPARPRATGISQEAVPPPAVLFDVDFVGPEGSHHKRLAQEKGVILAWAHSVSEGAAAELTVRPHTAVASDRRPTRFARLPVWRHRPTDTLLRVSQADATNAAEWIRQLLTVKIEHGDKQLAMMQSKVVADSDLLQDLLLMGVSGSIHALCALQALCEHNGAMCMKLCGHGLMDVSRDLLMGEKPEELRCAAAWLVDTVVSTNTETHRLVAKSRLVPAIMQALDGTTEADATFKDVRDASVHDHLTGIVCGLSHNSAQEKLLMASGCVESMLKLMATHRGAVRVNAACVVSNLVGREDNDSRMESDETIVEEVLDALKMTLEDRRVYGRRYATCSLTQSVANLANNDENKKRLVKAGAIPVLVQTLTQREEDWERALFWGTTGLWNLAFDEEIREKIKLEPGALDALAEARRVGSDDTKRKVKGALWMIEGQSEEAMEKTASVDAIEKLGNEGTVENAKGQVMLSYEWRTQQQVLRLRDILMEQGFTVWMDVDRMMGSTLEAMAIAIEQSDAIIMCVTHRYKESQACRTEAEYAYSRKKKLVPVMMEKGYAPDGWLGIIMGTKLYYNMHTVDEMSENVMGVIGEVRTVHQSLGRAMGLTAPSSSPDAPSTSSAGAATRRAPAEKKVNVPADAETMTSWLEERGLQRYAISFASAHVYGKALEQLHEEIGFHDPAEERYHDKFKTVLGMTSYGHRLLFLRELQEMLGPIKWRKRR